MPLPPTRHDALFRLLVSDPGRAAALLRDYLPPEVRERLDPDHAPEHIKGTAIDGEGLQGRTTQADAIFKSPAESRNTALWKSARRSGCIDISFSGCHDVLSKKPQTGHGAS